MIRTIENNSASLKIKPF